jgi:hypothetical protein
VTQHFVVAELCRRKAERLTHLSMYTCLYNIMPCDLSSHSILAGLPGDCACALSCEASFKLGKLVRGPGVDHELRLKSVPWNLTLSSLAWAK